MATNLKFDRVEPVDAGETAKLAAVPLRIEDPELIPSKRYYDQQFFDLERETLWPHVWQMACRLEQIPNVGDFTEYRILDKSVIIVRTNDGVKAFHNACRHRGVQLVSEPGNCKVKGFICPFHGWRWNMDGENTFVFGPRIFSPEILDKAELALAPCRVETWAGQAFINFDDDAAPLLDCLGPIADRLGKRNLEQLRMEWWYETVLPTNWKLAMEAFMEGYHTMRTHPQLQDLSAFNPYGDTGMTVVKQLDARGNVELYAKFLRRLSSGMSGMVHGSEADIAEELAGMELPEDPMVALGTYIEAIKAEVHKRGVANGLPVPDISALDASDPHRTVEFIFPHYFLLPFFGAMSSYRIRPLTAETCIFEIWSLAFLPDDHEPVRTSTVLPHESPDFPEIPRQDYDNLPLQQLGLHAGGFDNMRLSRDNEGLISNYQRLIDGFIAGIDRGKLTRAQVRVNDGFEHPIVDIGF